MNDGGAIGDDRYRIDKRLASSPDIEERRRVARRRDVKPELLYFLATDIAVPVRRDVAGNEATPWQADELLVRDRDEDVRVDLGRKLARLLPDMASGARDELRSRVVAMLDTLARDETVRVRTAIADAVKTLDCAPHDLIADLARDEALPVAEPVLRFSPLLDEEDLLAIIAGGHAEGALDAIAARAGLGGSVADAIVRCDDERAVATLLANPSAQVREETLDAIVTRAPGRPSWHAPLVDRPALPSRLASRLAAFVAQTLLAKLAARTDLDASTRDVINQAISAQLSGSDAAAPTTPVEPAEARVERMRREGKLDEDALWTALDQGDRGFIRAALALLAGIKEPIVDKILSARSAKGIVALAWKADIGPRLAYQVQLRMAGLSPRQALGPKNGTWPLTTDEMTWHLEFFGV